MNVQSEIRHERQASARWPRLLPAAESRTGALRPITFSLVCLFWIGQFGAGTLFMHLDTPQFTWVSLLPRALVCTAGAALTLACIGVQDRVRNASLVARGGLAIACTVVCAVLLAAFNYLMFEFFLNPPTTSGFWATLPGAAFGRLWVFGSAYAMWLAVSYWLAVHEREEEIASLKVLAQDAQLRALRSQLNPHFLFNALNTITALIQAGLVREAEETTENLSDFLRLTLAFDPQRLIPVQEEVSLQRIYLQIQRVRFPKRLNVEFDIAPEAEAALVPNLILQPLVENSIKHAVTQSTAPVTIRIAAHVQGQKLHLSVEDDGGNANQHRSAAGSRIGLSNVAERLAAHFGDGASCLFAASEAGGFRNALRIPLNRAA